MHITGDDLITHQRPVAAAVDRNLKVQMLADMQGIGKGFFQGLVAGDDGYTEQVQRRVGIGDHQRDGIIMSGITVEYHFGLFHFHISFIAFSDCIILRLERSVIGNISCFTMNMDELKNENLKKHYLADPFYRQFFPEDLADRISLVRCRNGEDIICQGQAGTALYVLLSGRCSVSQLLPSGRTVILRTHAAPCLFGEIELLRGQEAAMSIRTLQDCDLFRLPLDQVRNRLINDNRFLRNLCMYITEKEAKNSMQLFQTFAYPLENRLALFILNNLEGSRFRIKKVYIADSLGVSYRQTENIMRRFTEQGILRKQGLVYTVRDREALETLCREMKPLDSGL